MQAGYQKVLILMIVVVTLLSSMWSAKAERALSEPFQPYVRTDKLMASDRASGDEFGTAVVLSSDDQIMVVGAPLAAVDGKAHQGKVYIYRWTGEVWEEVQKITAENGNAEDRFGEAIDIADDYTIIVGATDVDLNGDDNIGAAYIFSYNGATWSQQVRLPISDEHELSHDNRGKSVAISSDGNLAFVGAPNVSISGRTRGTFYILSRSGSSWSQDQKIIGPTDGRALTGQAMFLSHDDNTLFVAGRYSPTGSSITRGIVHPYGFVGEDWTHQDEIIPSDSQEFDNFGIDITTSDDDKTLLVGAFGAEQAFVFTESSGVWNEQAILRSPTSISFGHFGHSVALNATGTEAAVGAWLNGSGGIHMFDGSGAVWQHAQVLRSPNRAQEHLGFAVAMTRNGEMVMGGARSAHPNLVDFDPMGAVYVYIPGYFNHLPTIKSN
ncbi:MAG: FG-GAP repeat protein [Chloroflexota bacterium]